MKEILGNVYEGVACIAWSRVQREKKRDRSSRKEIRVERSHRQVTDGLE